MPRKAKGAALAAPNSLSSVSRGLEPNTQRDEVLAWDHVVRRRRGPPEVGARDKAGAQAVGVERAVGIRVHRRVEGAQRAAVERVEHLELHPRLHRAELQVV